MQGISSRPYALGDLAACLRIFDSNVPTYFASEERAEFREYLEGVNATSQPYLVLVREASVVAGGGLYVEPGGHQARLSWGMVDRAFHGRGLGTILTEARLSLARTIPGVAEVGLETSQHTHGFYEKFGFIVTKVTPDGFGPGLDQWDMTLRLT